MSELDKEKVKSHLQQEFLELVAIIPLAGERLRWLW